MRKFGLIGYPLGHSFSKKYFTEKFVSSHLDDCIYENFPLTNLDNFIEFIEADKQLTGLNVTIPYKTEVIKYLHTVDKEAAEVGAVNVIKISRSAGRTTLSGYNSDIAGILDSLKPFAGDHLKNALVLGTGGSSKAVCYILKKLEINIILVSREKRINTITYSEITDKILDNTQLIINTTPLGMFPATDKKPELNYNRLYRNHILFDLVYNPEVTLFLKMGAERGCQTISGLKMLYSQAEKSWEIWNKS